MTIIKPPGQRFDNNTQVAVQVANTCRAPIKILPASLAACLPPGCCTAIN